MALRSAELWAEIADTESRLRTLREQHRDAMLVECPVQVGDAILIHGYRRVFGSAPETREARVSRISVDAWGDPVIMAVRVTRDGKIGAKSIRLSQYKWERKPDE